MARGVREPVLTDNARKIFDLRYSLKDELGRPTENPVQAVKRVARNIAQAGGKYADSGYEWVPQAKRYEEELLAPLKFVPNSPTWTGAGTDLGQLAACFVLPISDDLGRNRDSIFETMKVAALIQQTGGGNGFDFSDLRPKGALIRKSMGRSSGPVSFLKVYDSAFGSVQQGGTRRGANMGILRIDHPDIEEFIDAKLVEGEISNFNISVAVTDEFMRVILERDGGRDQSFPLTFEGHEVSDINPARLWDKLIEGAWTLGDPGVFFVDRANAQNPCPSKYTLAATNPCGEQALPPYSNCCLGAIAVNRFVERYIDGSVEFNWEAFADCIALSVQFLDDVVDANKYVAEVPELEQAAMNERRIGLGVMGLADCLFAMNLPYNGAEGFAFVDQLMEFLRYHAMLASIERARERGPFGWYEDSIYATGEWSPPESISIHVAYIDSSDYSFNRPTVDWAIVEEGISTWGIRNACQTTVAPTGTTSNFAGLEGSGIEPAFALSYVRTVMQEEENIKLHYLSNAFSAALPDTEVEANDIIAERIAKNGGSCQGVDGVPPWVQSVFVVAGDIAPRDHVRMQAICQTWVDNAISKTINLPHEATVEDVADCYKQAWLLGCKGITVYRQGSRELEVLTTKYEDATPTFELSIGQVLDADEWPSVAPVKVPDYVHTEGLPARAFEVETPFGTMQVYITELKDHRGRPFDIRLQIGKAGNDKHADVEAIGRMASVALRAGVHVAVLVDHLEGIGGQSFLGFGDRRVRSVGDGLGKLLRSLYLAPPAPETSSDGESPPDPGERSTAGHRNLHGVCPKCKNTTLVMESGCQHCETRLGGCGEYSACD